MVKMFLINFTIIGLFIILLIIEIYGQPTNYLSRLSGNLETNGADLKNDFTTNLDKLSQRPNDWQNYARIAIGVASSLLPPTMSLAIGMASSAFFYFYDAKLKKEEDELHHYENEKQKRDIQLFINDMTLKDNEIAKSIWIESHNIIQTIEKQIVGHQNDINNMSDKLIETLRNVVYKQTSFYDFHSVLNYFNIFYRDNIDCLLKNNCTPEDRQDLFDNLIIRGKKFRTTLSTFVTQFIYTSATLPTSIDRVPGFFTYLLDEYKLRAKERRDCNVESEQSEIYRLYTIIIMALQKSYSMVVTALMLRYCENIENKTLSEQYLTSAINALKTSSNDAEIITKMAYLALEKASTEIRRCDPIQHEKGKTYDRFVYINGTYTGYTYNRYYTKSNDSYSYIVDSLQKIKTFEVKPESSNDLYGRTNQGYVALNSKCKVHQDVAEVTHYYDIMDEQRLYHHIDFTYKNGTQKTFGKLAKNNQVIVFVTFQYPFKIFGKFCQSPFCPSPVKTCPIKTPDNAIHHISLVAVNASSGYVVTGIRWRIKNRILYFEIQEGKFIEGKLLTETIYWKETPTHEISNDKTVAIGKKTVKGFMMNDAHLPTDYLLSGVQFVWNKKILHGSDLVRIRIFGKRLYKKKILSVNYELPSWQENIMRLPLDNADASEYSTNNLILSKPGEHYIHFQPSDMKKDASQSTIPYLDIQEVVSNPPQPLQGLGLYFKGSYGYGGFIGLRGFTADLKTQIDPYILKHYRNITSFVLSKFYGDNQ